MNLIDSRIYCPQTFLEKRNLVLLPCVFFVVTGLSFEEKIISLLAQCGREAIPAREVSFITICFSYLIGN